MASTLEEIRKLLDTLDNAIDGNEMQVDVKTVTIPASLVYGQTTIGTAGTDVTLGSSSTFVIGVTVKALAGNGGLIYVGLEGVAAGTGFELSAGEQIFIPITNRATVWVDTSNSGDKVSYLGN